MYNPQIDVIKSNQNYKKKEKLANPIIICYDYKTKLPIELK